MSIVSEAVLSDIISFYFSPWRYALALRSRAYLIRCAILASVVRAFSNILQATNAHLITSKYVNELPERNQLRIY